MIEPRSKIELAIRAAGLGADILSLVKCNDKLVARFILQQAYEQFKALAEFVEKLPKD